MPLLSRLFVASGLLGLTICGEAADESDTFTPVRFLAGDESFAEMIQFPARSGDVNVTVICTSHGTRGGQVTAARCSSPDDPDGVFSLAAVDAAGDAEIESALVDGRKQDVDFQFSVVFSRTRDAERITVLTNNQRNTERLGLDYVSAQRYSRHLKPKMCHGRGDAPEFAILEMAVVGTDGNAKQSRVYAGDVDLGDSCIAALQRQLADSRWIPAIDDGVAVESTWVNSWIMTPYDLPVN